MEWTNAHTHREDVAVPCEADEVFIPADNLHRWMIAHYLDWLDRHTNLSGQTELAVTTLSHVAS